MTCLAWMNCQTFIPTDTMGPTPLKWFFKDNDFTPNLLYLFEDVDWFFHLWIRKVWFCWEAASTSLFCSHLTIENNVGDPNVVKGKGGAKIPCEILYQSYEILMAEYARFDWLMPNNAWWLDSLCAILAAPLHFWGPSMILLLPFTRIRIGVILYSDIY